MGSRGAFVDVNMGNFTFKDGGQNYFSIGTLSSEEENDTPSFFDDETE